MKINFEAFFTLSEIHPSTLSTYSHIIKSAKYYWNMKNYDSDEISWSVLNFISK